MERQGATRCAGSSCQGSEYGQETEGTDAQTGRRGLTAVARVKRRQGATRRAGSGGQGSEYGPGTGETNTQTEARCETSRWPRWPGF
jgi:hypothetical protein